MSSPVEPIRPGASWSRLAAAVERIQAAESLEAGLEMLAQAALELAVVEPASAVTSQPAEPSLWALENVVLRQRLVEKEERLRLALDAASLGTWEHVPSTHATYWDARSKAIFGLAPDEELDFDRYMAALHPDDVPGVFAGISKSVDPLGSGRCSLEYRIRRADGAERWVEAHGRCVFVDGVAQRINGTLLDVTERRRAADAVRDAARRKDEFLALLGHELRNPLAPILTALELMRAAHPEAAVREREVIDRQVRHMMRLVDDLLDLARVARGSITLRRESVDLRSATERAVEMARPLFETRQHHLEIEVTEGLRVDVDPVRFSQIVANLLTNAAKFTPSSGQVKVRGYARESEVLLEVEDDGIGMEPRHLEAIFEPFVQARRGNETHGGLGLGLSLVRDLVQLHGGSVQAESAGLGQGSRFTLRLPRGKLDASTSTVSPMERASLSPLRVLVVDDNRDSADMLALLLSEIGHEVRVAYDGFRALDVASEFEPNAAVLDIGLPVMDGYTLATQLRERHGARGLRLFALTGFGQEQDKVRCLEAGFHRHLTKPIHAWELAAALAE